MFGVQNFSCVYWLNSPLFDVSLLPVVAGGINGVSVFRFDSEQESVGFSAGTGKGTERRLFSVFYFRICSAERFFLCSWAFLTFYFTRAAQRERLTTGNAPFPISSIIISLRPYPNLPNFMIFWEISKMATESNAPLIWFVTSPDNFAYRKNVIRARLLRKAKVCSTFPLGKSNKPEHSAVSDIIPIATILLGQEPTRWSGRKSKFG